MLLMTLPRTEDAIQGEELNHWTWEENDNESYCGLDVTNEPWIPDSVPITCKRCIEIDMLCEMWEAQNA